MKLFTSDRSILSFINSGLNGTIILYGVQLFSGLERNEITRRMTILQEGIPLWGDHRLLTTTTSFELRKNDDGTMSGPTKISTIASMFLFIGVISLSQQLTFFILFSLKVSPCFLFEESFNLTKSFRFS